MTREDVKKLIYATPQDETYSKELVLHAMEDGALLLIEHATYSKQQWRLASPYSVLPGATVVSLEYLRRGEESVTHRQLIFRRESDADTFIDSVYTIQAISPCNNVQEVSTR